MQAAKIALGGLVAILISEAIGLQHAPSAAIIALLTTLATKKETYVLSLKRAVSFVFTILLCLVIYHFIGVHSLSFGIFMFVMVSVSYLLRWHGAISVNAVIGTHMLAESSVHWQFILNEALLVLIGSSIAILLNFYMPSVQKMIKRDIAEIEAQERKILYQFSHYLVHMVPGEKDHQSIYDLELYLEESLSRAIRNAGNTMFEHSKYFISYMEMRKSQCDILHQIQHSLHSMTSIPPQARIISDFFRHMADTFGERNNAVGLLDEIKDILKYMEREPLPQSRCEFENRAILYHVLIELEGFLILKKEFVERLTPEQIEIYWRDAKRSKTVETETITQKSGSV